MEEKSYFHAIIVNEDRCTGCMRCVRVCPTEAIRVRKGKVEIDYSRCIDCGKCIKTCQFAALLPASDPFEIINNYKYKLAIISASYAGQFSEEIDYPTAKKALLSLGFDEVAEESMVNEISVKMKRDYIFTHPEIRPILSSNCPAVVRLIQVRFPSLLPHLLHIEAPMSILSMFLRDKIVKEKNLKEEEIGIFLIVPCIAQVTAVHQPEGAYKRIHEGALSIRDIYNKVREKMKTAQADTTPIETYEKGLSWALSGLEADEVTDQKIRTLEVSGIENVSDILKKIEDHLLDQYEYIVLRNCTYGCVGGELNVESPFIAASRIKKLVKNSNNQKVKNQDILYEYYQDGFFDVLPLEPRSIMELDKDIKQAIQKMKKMKEILNTLPNIDCGACGAPSCHALAEDIVQGKATLEDCVILLRDGKN